MLKFTVLCSVPTLLSSVLCVLMADLAIRIFFVIFHNLICIFIQRNNIFSIIMLREQIILNIMHVGSILT